MNLEIKNKNLIIFKIPQGGSISVFKGVQTIIEETNLLTPQAQSLKKKVSSVFAVTFLV